MYPSLQPRARVVVLKFSSRRTCIESLCERKLQLIRRSVLQTRALAFAASDRDVRSKNLPLFALAWYPCRCTRCRVKVKHWLAFRFSTAGAGEPRVPFLLVSTADAARVRLPADAARVRLPARACLQRHRSRVRESDCLHSFALSRRTEMSLREREAGGRSMSTEIRLNKPLNKIYENLVCAFEGSRVQQKQRAPVRCSK